MVVNYIYISFIPIHYAKYIYNIYIYIRIYSIVTWQQQHVFPQDTLISSATSNLALWRDPLKSLKGDHSWLRYSPTPTPSGGITGGSPWFEASDDVFTPLRIALGSWKRPGHHSDVKICQDQDMSRAHRCPSARRKFWSHPSHQSHQAILTWLISSPPVTASSALFTKFTP